MSPILRVISKAQFVTSAPPTNLPSSACSVFTVSGKAASVIRRYRLLRTNLNSISAPPGRRSAFPRQLPRRTEAQPPPHRRSAVRLRRCFRLASLTQPRSVAESGQESRGSQCSRPPSSCLLSRVRRNVRAARLVLNDDEREAQGFLEFISVKLGVFLQHQHDRISCQSNTMRLPGGCGGLECGRESGG